MADLLDKQEAVLPSKEDAELAAESSRILAKARGENSLRVRLNEHEELTLPKSVTHLLYHILTEMSHGNAVTIIPVHAELTTQEAADHLNVSRPYLIKLLEAGDIAYHMVGTHRRIRFDDLDAYKKAKQAHSRSALDELAQQAQELNMGY